MAAEKYELAERDYIGGMKYKDIAAKYEVSLNTVKSWKKRYGWDRKGCTQKKKGAHKKKVHGNTIAQLGNKNANGAPKGNKRAEKYGLFAKYMPAETLDIMQSIEKANPLDLLWDQIQIAYTAIIRAQKIAYVKNREDATVRMTMDGDAVTSYQYQEAWDKHNNFMKAQARAQGELRSLIKQYDEMLHRDWELATEEQKARIEQIKAQTDKIKGEDSEVEYLDDIEGDIYDEA